MDPRFRVDLIAATPNPQQCVYAGMHQDYSEGFVADDRAHWPAENRPARSASSACWPASAATTDHWSTPRLY